VTSSPAGSRLQLAGLSKRYGRTRILDPTSLDLGAGIKVLAGANGVGKTTLLSVLAGIEPADGGDVYVHGISLRRAPVEAKGLLAYVPDRPSVYPFLTGLEFLTLVHRFKGVRDTGGQQGLLERFGIASSVATPFGRMSLGMQRKFLIVAALIGAPRVVLMDEPTNGLDAASRQALVEISRRGQSERLFLYATHDREFIERCGAELLLLRDAQITAGVSLDVIAAVRVAEDEAATPSAG
jgi:ABC-2 type transport system ATP-binding protein